ncbi:hypothetical protein PF010_g21349 [Phytophthora fragariae]|uniref:Uncharacterized protein n=1 Tax=Phytophthora fragariae TaxID=53985 RepID=A0A6G0KBJ5_9STRA|nr:hypothetical protein PF010_g21349 [Phytophthora fragariae]
MGHEIVDVVIQAGHKVKDLQVGDHRQRRVLPASRVNEQRQVQKRRRHHLRRLRRLHARAPRVRDQDPRQHTSGLAVPLMCAGTTVFTPFKEAGMKEGDRVGHR